MNLRAPFLLTPSIRINLKKILLYLIPYSIVRWILHGGEELKLREAFNGRKF